MSDLPPYLTHNDNRREPWKGHATFPRNVVRCHVDGRWGSYGPLKIEDLRIFKLERGPDVYWKLSEEDIQHYMEDPTRV